MKRNGLFVLVLALAAVLCTGCGVKDEDLKSDPLVNADVPSVQMQERTCVSAAWLNSH